MTTRRNGGGNELSKLDASTPGKKKFPLVYNPANRQQPRAVAFLGSSQKASRSALDRGCYAARGTGLAELSPALRWLVPIASWVCIALGLIVAFLCAILATEVSHTTTLPVRLAGCQAVALSAGGASLS